MVGGEMVAMRIHSITMHRTKTLPPRLLRGRQRDVRHVDLASDGQRCKKGALVLADNVDEFSNN
jgi:hypothetical protein